MWRRATAISDDIEQIFNTIAPNRRNDAKLGKMGTDRIDHCGLLADEQMAGAMEHPAGLLLGCLGRHEPHVSPGDRLASRRRAASSAPCDQAPAVRATNDETRRRLRCQPGTGVASGKTAKRSGVWAGGERLHYLRLQPRGLDTTTLRCRDRLS